MIDEPPAVHGKSSAGTRRFVPAGIFGLFYAAISLGFVGCEGSGKEPLEEKLNQIYPLDSTAAVTVTNRDGSIRIYGGGDELRVQATKKAYSAERLRQIKINVTTAPDAASVTTDFPPTPKWGLSDRSGTVDYIIVVPETARLVHAELADGELAVEGLREGRVRARLGNGLMFARNNFGDLELGVGTGNLSLSFDWWERAQLVVDAIVERGHIRSFFPSDAAFRLQADAPNGKIVNDFVEKQERRGEPANKIDMIVGAGGDVRVKIRANNGNIRITETNP